MHEIRCMKFLSGGTGDKSLLIVSVPTISVQLAPMIEVIELHPLLDCKLKTVPVNLGGKRGLYYRSAPGSLVD